MLTWRNNRRHMTLKERPLEVTFSLESVWGWQPSQDTDTAPSQPTRPLNPSKLFTKNIKRDNESHLGEEHIWLESLEKIMALSSHLHWWHFSHHSKPLWVKNRRGPITWYILLRYILMCSIPVWKISFVLSKHPWRNPTHVRPHTEIHTHMHAHTNIHTQTKVHSGINHRERTIWEWMVTFSLSLCAAPGNQ